MAAIEPPVAWYIYRAGRQHGPMPDVELALLAKTNVLHGSDLIWCEGLPDWVQAGDVAGLLQAEDVPQPVPQSRFNGLTQAYLDARAGTRHPAFAQPAAGQDAVRSAVPTMLPSTMGVSAALLPMGITAAPSM